MEEFLLDSKIRCFQFTLAFDLRGHRSPQIDAKGIKGEIILPGSKMALKTHL